MEAARGGMLNESHIPRKARLLGKCCRDRAGGDFNYEVLCFNHMRTFEGFLSMVEDPPDGASESNRNSNNGKNDGYDARSIDDKIRNSPSWYVLDERLLLRRLTFEKSRQALESRHVLPNGTQVLPPNQLCRSPRNCSVSNAVFGGSDSTDMYTFTETMHCLRLP